MAAALPPDEPLEDHDFPTIYSYNEIVVPWLVTQSVRNVYSPLLFIVSSHNAPKLLLKSQISEQRKRKLKEYQTERGEEEEEKEDTAAVLVEDSCGCGRKHCHIYVYADGTGGLKSYRDFSNYFLSSANPDFLEYVNRLFRQTLEYTLKHNPLHPQEIRTASSNYLFSLANNVDIFGCIRTLWDIIQYTVEAHEMYLQRDETRFVKFIGFFFDIDSYLTQTEAVMQKYNSDIHKIRDREQPVQNMIYEHMHYYLVCYLRNIYIDFAEPPRDCLDEDEFIVDHAPVVSSHDIMHIGLLERAIALYRTSLNEDPEVVARLRADLESDRERAPRRRGGGRRGSGRKR